MIPDIELFSGGVISWILDFLRSIPVIQNAAQYIQNATAQSPTLNGFMNFLSACINLLVPVDAVGVCIVIILPALTVSLVLSIIYRIKSFIPTMGD